MRLSEILRMALGSLGANKLRSSLTMLGITIGVFSVIGVMTAVTALRGSIETGLSFLGANIFQFAKYPLTGGGGHGDSRRKIELRRDITLDQALRFKRLMAGTTDTVCLKIFDQNPASQATYLGRKTSPGLTFVGSDENFLTANQFTIALGRNFTPDDVDLARPVVLIGQEIVKRLFPSEDPLRKLIKLRERTYTVVGVFAEKGNQFGQSSDGIEVIPVTRFLADHGAEKRSINIATQALSQIVYNDTLDRAVTAMRIVRGLRPEQENDFEIYSNDSLIAVFAKVADVIAAGSFVISGIALLAAGVGIMNIMLVSVTERTREIGLRMAVGATKKAVELQFLCEALVLSMIGGILGILIGMASSYVISRIFQWSTLLSAFSIGIAVFFSAGVGIFFGYWPARKAARLDP
ncbi:MAG: ABC transporter permease, partial [Opitutae bacterium]|nr:ABC transporter permease [Opitutae bacterium]